MVVKLGFVLFFGEMAPGRNKVSWNVMISRYSGDALFSEMRRQGVLADEFTLVSLILACTSKTFY
jgi:hypothetical protein